jgi:hypothetical protein
MLMVCERIICHFCRAASAAVGSQRVGGTVTAEVKPTAKKMLISRDVRIMN